MTGLHDVTPLRGMTRLLASVQNEHEALEALAGGADIVDFKNALQGALGALDPEVITSGLKALGGRAVTSATAGDWALEPHLLIQAVRRTGATGVNYVKLGLLAGPALEPCIDALASTARELRIVAVFFADRCVPLDALCKLRCAGFAGAMIDTFDKLSGGLRRHLSDAMLGDFVAAGKRLGLLTGLAGSLRLEDIPSLAAVEPDLLGFRGALCDDADRTTPLSAARVRSVRAALDQAAVARCAPLAN